MNYITRYAIKMKNGQYMKEDFDGSLNRVKLRSVSHPIDSTLIPLKSTATRCLYEILNGDTNILVLVDEDNPPVSVEEVRIKVVVTMT